MARRCHPTRWFAWWTPCASICRESCLAAAGVRMLTMMEEAVGVEFSRLSETEVKTRRTAVATSAAKASFTCSVCKI
eukprot:2020981-Pleurochrysis_carterae.AAC.1